MSPTVAPAEVSIAPSPATMPPPARPVASAHVDTLEIAPQSRYRAPARGWRWPKFTVPGSPQQWADALWYAGHVMSVGSLVSRYSLPTAAVLVGLGQLMVIVSRPLGRVPATARPADDSV